MNFMKTQLFIITVLTGCVSYSAEVASNSNRGTTSCTACMVEQFNSNLSNQKLEKIEIADEWALPSDAPPKVEKSDFLSKETSTSFDAPDRLGVQVAEDQPIDLDGIGKTVLKGGTTIGRMKAKTNSDKKGKTIIGIEIPMN